MTAADDPHAPELTLEIKSFEIVKVSVETVLLRLAFRLPAGSGELDRPLELVISGRGEVHRLDPLPSPVTKSRVRRAAFVGAVSLIEGDPAFSLQCGPGAPLGLPRPRPGKARRRPAARGQTDGAAPRERRTSAYEHLAAQSEQLAAERHARENAERDVTAALDARAAAEHQLRQVRERLDDALAARSEADRPRSATQLLQQQLDDALNELAAVSRAERDAAAQARHLRERLDRQGRPVTSV